MVLTTLLGSEIKNYIFSLTGKEVRIVDPSGVCISSISDNEIGLKIEIDLDLTELKIPQPLEIDGHKTIVLPLNYENEVSAALIIPNEKDNVSEYVPLIKSFAELLITQHYENNKPTLDSTDQFIIKLLNNATPAEYPFYESEAKALGYDLSKKRLAIVIHLDGFWEKCLLCVDQSSFERDEVIKTSKRNIETAIKGFFSRDNDIIVAFLGNDKFVVFKSVSENDEKTVKKFLEKSFKSIFEPLKSFRIQNITTGYGNSHEGISGLVSAYKEADLSLELGNKLWGPNRSNYFADLGILRVIGEGNREKNVEFAKQMLSKMKSPDLIETLNCFFDQNLNLTETAEELGVHRNTVIYRLNQISKILGSDPRIFDQAMSIKVALLIQRLFT